MCFFRMQMLLSYEENMDEGMGWLDEQERALNLIKGYVEVNDEV